MSTDPRRLGGFKARWKVIRATPAERSVIEALARENRDHVEFEIHEVEEDPDGIQIAKMTVRCSSVEWLEMVWWHVQSVFWATQMLESALRIQQIMHPECEVTPGS